MVERERPRGGAWISLTFRAREEEEKKKKK